MCLGVDSMKASAINFSVFSIFFLLTKRLIWCANVFYIIIDMIETCTDFIYWFASYFFFSPLLLSAYFIHNIRKYLCALNCVMCTECIIVIYFDNLNMIVKVIWKLFVENQRLSMLHNTQVLVAWVYELYVGENFEKKEKKRWHFKSILRPLICHS